jgi:hypothetical protein
MHVPQALNVHTPQALANQQHQSAQHQSAQHQSAQNQSAQHQSAQHQRAHHPAAGVVVTRPTPVHLLPLQQVRTR